MARIAPRAVNWRRYGVILLLLAMNQGIADNSEPGDPLTDQEPQGRALLKKFCSQCHGPPSPSSHAPGEWKNIVLRMHNHRTMKGYEAMSPLQIEQLTAYLDENAKGSGS